MLRLKYKVITVVAEKKKGFWLKLFDGIINIPVHVQFNFFPCVEKL